MIAKASIFGYTPVCNTHAVAVIFGSFNALHVGRIVGSVLLAIAFVAYTCLLVWDYSPYWRQHSCPKQNPTIEGKGNSVDLPQLRFSYPRRSEFRKDSFRNAERGLDLDYASIKERTEESRIIDAFAQEHLEEIIRKKGNHGSQPTKYFDQALFVCIMLFIILWTLLVMNIELLVKSSRFSNGSGDVASQFQLGQVSQFFFYIFDRLNLRFLIYRYSCFPLLYLG